MTPIGRKELEVRRMYEQKPVMPGEYFGWDKHPVVDDSYESIVGKYRRKYPRSYELLKTLCRRSGSRQGPLGQLINMRSFT